MSQQTEPKRYTIVTIADLFEQIPPSKVDHCLLDLATMLKTYKQIESIVGQFAKSEIKLLLRMGFVWVDDGKHDITLVLESEASQS